MIKPDNSDKLNRASRPNALLRKVILGIILLIVFLHFPNLCDGHSHSHDDGHGHSHGHEINEPPSFKYSQAANVKKHSSDNNEKLERNQNTLHLWLEALGSTLLISAAPFFILFLVPLDSSKEKEPLLKLLLSFASGGLLGDAFLHLIPHALTPHSHGSDHSHTHEAAHSHSHGHEHGVHDMSVGLWVLSGILTFLVVEKIVRFVKGGHGHSHNALNEEQVQNTDNSKSDKGTKRGKSVKKKDKASDSEGEDSDNKKQSSDLGDKQNKTNRPNHDIQG